MVIIGLILVLYCLLILWLMLGFDKVTGFHFSNPETKTPFSIIIPLRNEVDNLPFLLNSIKQLNYPIDFMEFIFIDDESSDDSVQLITQSLHGYDLHFSIIKNIRTSNSPKKDAIQTAIQLVKYEWVITTDADCVLPENWLACYSAFIQENNPELIAGPVLYTKEKSFLQRLQEVEFHTLQAATIGSFGIGRPMMCNGANLAYKKTAFFKVNGFEGNNSLASGDDVFLLEKIQRQYKNGVYFLKSKAVLVNTSPQKTWKGFIEQHVRWASKSTNYQSSFTKRVGLVVFLGNFALVIASFLVLFQLLSIMFLLVVFATKILIDTLLLLKFERYFTKKRSLKMYIIGGITYPFINIYILILTMFSGYSWKGRYFKK